MFLYFYNFYASDATRSKTQNIKKVVCRHNTLHKFLSIAKKYENRSTLMSDRVYKNYNMRINALSISFSAISPFGNPTPSQTAIFLK
jgi:hypothetical protein